MQAARSFSDFHEGHLYWGKDASFGGHGVVKGVPLGKPDLNALQGFFGFGVVHLTLNSLERLQNVNAAVEHGRQTAEKNSLLFDRDAHDREL
jgi:hypothetical protein